MTLLIWTHNSISSVCIKAFKTKATFNPMGLYKDGVQCPPLLLLCCTSEI